MTNSLIRLNPFQRPAKDRPNLGLLPMDRFALAVERIERFALFSAQQYGELHEDARLYGPARHFVAYGGEEGRRAVRPTHIARILGNRIAAGFAPPAERTVDARGMTVGVYCSSLGNRFMSEIAANLAACLGAAGATVIEGDENADMAARPRHAIYVAPHEFFLLGNGRNWVRDDVFAQACLYCTEQPQTTWFWRALPYVLMAEKAIDMSAHTAALFAEVMPAGHLLPAVNPPVTTLEERERRHPLLAAQRWWLDDDRRDMLPAYGERPLDLSFFGGESEARDRFFARQADLLCRHECLFYLRKRNATRVVAPAHDEGDLTRIAAFVAGRSRIALNLHRDEFGHFEWHRMAYQAMTHGALVLSEPCLPDPEFRENVHYLAEEQRYLGEYAGWLLETPEGRARAKEVIANASALISQGRSREAVGTRLAAILQTSE